MELKPYRVRLACGLETTLMLSEETVKRDYPTAVRVPDVQPEVKTGRAAKKA